MHTHSNYIKKTGRSIRIKSRFRLCLFITLALLLFISIFSSIWLKGNAMTPLHTIHVTVGEGDTLWLIARRTLPRNRDIRDYILEIKEVNQLANANILVGQSLLVPIYHNLQTSEKTIGELHLGMND